MASGELCPTARSGSAPRRRGPYWGTIWSAGQRRRGGAMTRARVVGILGGIIAAITIVQPAGAAGITSSIKAIVIHRSDLGADYEKVFTGASPQPLWDMGPILHMNAWRNHGYLGDWASRFGHDTAGARHQMDGQISSNVDAYSSPANAHWAFLRERKAYKTAAPVSVATVGDES